MKVLLFTLTGIAFLLVATAAEKKPATKPRVKAAPNAAFAKVDDVPGLPRVLLIGDSISIGYTLDVRKLLADKANVHRIAENGGPTKNGVVKLGKWLGDGKWDVIHFNWGLHDLRFMPDGKRQVEPAEYEQNLRDLVKQMKATGAKLVWCSTTPVPAGDLNPPRKVADVALYNSIAARVMKDAGVVNDDLYTYAMPKIATIQRPLNVHYTDEGYAFLAQQVAASITAQLPGK
jgi:acyl-CoA thioesterase-1